MKTTFFFALFCLLWINVTAQFPQAIKYQAVVRDNAGQILANKAVSFQISILNGNPTGAVVYREHHLGKTTNTFGLVDLEIGKGTSDGGTFSAINWSSGSYFIKVEIFPEGATDWQEMGTIQVLSVPYALYAKDVQNNDDADADAFNEIQVLSKSGNTVTLSKNGGSFTDAVDDADADPANELQDIQLTGMVLGLTKSSKTITLPSSGSGDNWGTQVVKTNITLTGQGNDASPLGVANAVITPSWTNIQNIPSGFADNVDNVNDADADTTNELQDLKLTGTLLGLTRSSKTVNLPSPGIGDNWGTDVVKTDVTLEGEGTISKPLKIGSQSALPGQTLKWDGSAWKPATDNVDDADNSITNEIQTLSLTGNNLGISGANTVVLPVSPGDGWGTQVVKINATLTGQGTDANPLGVANMIIAPLWANIQNKPAGFADGIDNVQDADADTTNELQELQLTGTVLGLTRSSKTVNLPSPGIGDNWGTQTSATDGTLAGNGTIESPLKIAQQLATSGQVLKWNGITWVPSTDISGGLNLPYYGNTSDSEYTFKIKTPGSTATLNYKSPTTGLNMGVKGETESSGGGVYGSSTAITGDSWGVYGVSTSNQGVGIHGYASSAAGQTYGVYGRSDSGTGKGVFGYASASEGKTDGVSGKVESSSGIGVHGLALSNTGTNYGVYGESGSSSGHGVKGIANSATGINVGVEGESASSSGYGVSGFASSTTGLNTGVKGETASSAGYGVYGLSSSQTGYSYGVVGESSSNQGTGLYGHSGSIEGTTRGVYGHSASVSGTGVFGQASANEGTTNGVWGTSESSSGIGVYGNVVSAVGTNYGVFGKSASNSGVGMKGITISGTGTTFGVVGLSHSSSGTGIYGSDDASGGITTGIKGEVASPDGYSGYFTGGKFLVSGQAQIIGALSMANFKISDVANPVNAQDAATKAYVDAIKEIIYNELLDAGLNGIVKDADDNTYKTIKIGTQVWMVENLKTTKFNNGSAIPDVTDNTSWAALTTGAYCWYNNDTGNKNIYGGLYNWYAVNTGKLCPTGWHVPGDAEWTILTNYLGGESIAGGKLKESGIIHWRSPNAGATNEVGFTALPTGYRNYNNGTFFGIEYDGSWWSLTETSTKDAYDRYLNYNYSNLNKGSNDKNDGRSVRCVRD